MLSLVVDGSSWAVAINCTWWVMPRASGCEVVGAGAASDVGPGRHFKVGEPRT